MTASPPSMKAIRPATPCDIDGDDADAALGSALVAMSSPSGVQVLSSPLLCSARMRLLSGAKAAVDNGLSSPMRLGTAIVVSQMPSSMAGELALVQQTA